MWRIDLVNAQSLRAVFGYHHIDAICHLAAQAGVRYSLENPQAYIDSNITGTLNIFEMARRFYIPKVIYASSSSVYGGNTKIPFSVEDIVEQPISMYAQTKRSNELMAYTYNHLFKVNMIGLRFFTVYGPWGRPDMALFIFTKAIQEGKPIDIFNYGKMERDFTYIDDIVNGIVASLNYDASYDIFNLGNSSSVQLEYFIKCIEKELKKKANKNYLPMQAGDVPKTFADIEHSKKCLGFEPKVKIEEGIKRFIEWYKYYHKLV
jgi:UDP-glucuronate 4-epimerase